MELGNSGLSDIFTERALYADLVLGFRFGVFFFAGGVLPNPLDIRFQKVSGLTAEVSTTDIGEGGQITQDRTDNTCEGNNPNLRH